MVLRFCLLQSIISMCNIVAAINDACLVFDGRLVIDAKFHTNDVAIRGVGPITKFQRSYHAEPWTHANYNSKEIGIQVRPLLFDISLLLIVLDILNND